MIAVAENRYGKSRVRLVQVKRRAGWHDFREWTVGVLLGGDFDSCFVEGDNRKILPTDTMKNTVYSLARNSNAKCMENFAKEVIDFLLERNPQVTKAEVSISERAWDHLQVAGKPHPTTFVQTTGETQTTTVRRTRPSAFSVTSGLENLVIMKTAGSGFEDYIQDSLTTLQPAKDRLLGTAASARWTYSKDDGSFPSLRAEIRDVLLAEFAAHESKSVQHTLYAMGKAALEQVPEIEDISLTMPNKHCLLVDLSRFGQDNPNEVFVPIDEPHGYIEARLRRQG
jgi:urate oxidase